MNYQQLLERLTKDLPISDTVTHEVYKMVMPSEFWFWFIIAALVIGFIILSMLFIPIYSVWASKKRGQAEIAQANFSEQVAIAEATARLKSAEMNKDAEIIEAEAVSNSIKVIGDSLSKNESYLRWQWIKSMADSDNEKIYIPTEANLPILEAKNTNSIVYDEDE